MNELYIDGDGRPPSTGCTTRQDDVTGVVITSAKKTFFAGGDLKLHGPGRPGRRARRLRAWPRHQGRAAPARDVRRPVVAAINGAALGGGLEIALACQPPHRCVDDPRSQIGLPEVTLGLLPGGGGVTRAVRLLGIQTALMDVLLRAPASSPARPRRRASSTSSSPTREELVPAAKAWIKANPRRRRQNPWDRQGYKMPGGTPSTPGARGDPAGVPGAAAQADQGRGLPRAAAIMCAAVEGARVDFDTASRIESRYLTKLVVNQGSKNMIQAFFFDLQAINAGSLRPTASRRTRRAKVGVLGAGMMGAGIAYVLRPGRHGGRPQGRRARARREGQGVLREAARQGHLARQAHRGEEGRAARPDHRRPRTRPTSPAATWSSRRSSRTRR